jgi:hypothetical protein
MNESLGSLVSGFEPGPEWRAAHGKGSPLSTVLTIPFLAIWRGEQSRQGSGRWRQDQGWGLGKALDRQGYRVPGDETIRPVLGAGAMVAVEGPVHGWAKPVATAYPVTNWPGVAVEGQTLRGRREGDTAAIHLGRAFRPALERVVSPPVVNGQTNEIPIARDRLRPWIRDGLLITCDACHTQRDRAALIVTKKGPIGGWSMTTNRPSRPLGLGCSAGRPALTQTGAPCSKAPTVTAGLRLAR